MIIGYIDKLNEYLEKAIKVNIYGLDDLVDVLKTNLTASLNSGAFLETNYILNQRAQELGIILDSYGNGSVLILMVDGLMLGLNSVLVMGDKRMSFTYYSYTPKPIKEELTIKL